MRGIVKTPNSDLLDGFIAELMQCYAELVAYEASVGDKDVKRKLKAKLRYQANNINELIPRI